MKRRRIMGLAAFGAVAALTLAACSSGSSSAGGGSGGTKAFNAALTQVVNPSNSKNSGTISFGNSSTPASTPTRGTPTTPTCGTSRGCTRCR